ncbi:hypothetical protein AgCh_014455 [Apium graveolens]
MGVRRGLCVFSGIESTTVAVVAFGGVVLCDVAAKRVEEREGEKREMRWPGKKIWVPSSPEFHTDGDGRLLPLKPVWSLNTMLVGLDSKSKVEDLD